MTHQKYFDSAVFEARNESKRYNTESRPFMFVLIFIQMLWKFRGGTVSRDEILKAGRRAGYSTYVVDKALEKHRADGNIYCPKFTRKGGKFKCLGYMFS